MGLAFTAASSCTYRTAQSWNGTRGMNQNDTAAVEAGVMEGGKNGRDGREVKRGRDGRKGK